MRPVTAVSDFSAKVSKHFHYSSVMPLSEANLSKHTLQSPPSREAKLKHILVYVDLQRELIEVEEELYRSMTEQNRLTKTASAKQKQQQLQQQQLQLERLEQQQQQLQQQSNKPQAHANQQGPAVDEVVGKDKIAHEEEHEDEENDDEHEHEHGPASFSAPQVVSPSVVVDGSVVSPFNVALASTHPQQQMHQSQQTDQPKHQQRVVTNTAARRHKRSSTISDAAFDPSLALPRALPRSTPLLYRDSLYSGEPEGEGEGEGQGDPDSPTLPYNTLEPKFASFEENIAYKLTKVSSRDERQQRPGFRHHPQQSSTTTATLGGGGARPVQYRRRTDDSSTVDPLQFASLPGLALTRTTQTQPEKEKEKKSGGILSRFSFLGRKQQQSQQESGHHHTPQHPRHESAPGTTRVGTSATVAAATATSPTEHARFHSLNYSDGENFRDDTPVQGPTKRRSKVKALFQDFFKKSSAATSTPAGKAGVKNFQHLEPLQPPKMKQDPHKKRYPGSGHGMLSSGAIIIQREDIPPRAATSLSHYDRDQQQEKQERQREQRESMIDPTLQLAQLQQLSSGSRPSGEEEERAGQCITTYPQYEEIYIKHEEQQRDSNSVYSPFGEFGPTSSTRPRPLSVAHHSTGSFSSSNRNPSGGQKLSSRDDLEGNAGVESKQHLDPAQAEKQGEKEAKEAENDGDEDLGLESSAQNLAQKTRPSSSLLPLAGAIKELMKNSNNNDHYDINDPSSPYDGYTNNFNNQPSLNSNEAHGNGNHPRRMVALTPEQHADLEDVGIRQNTYGLASA